MRGGGYFIVKNPFEELSREDVRVSTNAFYKTLGFESYDCIDLDGAYNALHFNLNVNFATTYNFTEQFSLVTNFGTTEHILNQGTCFENVHNLCEKDGIMVHGLPIYGYLNHGFFTYSLKFFMRLAVFNTYEFLQANILEAGYNKNGELYIRNPKVIQRIDCIASIYDYIKTSESFDLELPRTAGGSGFIALVALRKKSNKPFSYPLDMPMYSSKSKETLEFFIGKMAEKLHKVAIFGSKKAANIAFDFMQRNAIETLCFIDDFVQGVVEGIPIVTYADFVEKYQMHCDCVIKGPLQRGDIEGREGLLVDVISMEYTWFG
ncbi:hypothetical protein [Helicobacter sp.]|uniref:hypothetical protein n=1 Tax=Helicobacter sp. TaxID=218 RepID=UPI0025C01B8A|nr:hypothetical protein [Helicobacter sp.]MCI5968985.1 hypothetical protein [Helicobacter sp.]